MKKVKLSGPAVFMYSVILLTVFLSAVCFCVYYSEICEHDIVLWTGIVSFMILYHFGLRILMGHVTKRVRINGQHPWFRHYKFEKKLYKLLRVRAWKDKVLTFEPENYDIKNRTLEQLASTMVKSELDHWINQIISLFGISFLLVWGCAPAFIITAVAAMLFDAQFIVVQRYNRPIVLNVIKARERLQSKSLSKRVDI